jgi:DNA segregation ATPase FtsK/SpoIIIE, S-DNA-T family
LIIQRTLAALRAVGRWPWQAWQCTSRWRAALGPRLVTYWPGLAYLAIATRTVCAWSGWRWLARVGLVVSRAMDRVLRWVGRVCWRAGRAVWHAVEPFVRDLAGWLVHTAPRLAVRLTGRAIVRLLRRGLPALVRVLGLAALGTWWLLVRLVRYVFAYPEYAPLVRELEEDGRARRALAARNAWRRAFYRRITGSAVVALVVGLLVAGLVDQYGARAVLGLVVAVTAVLAGVGRAIRPRPNDLGSAEEERGEDEPYPIADAHTRAEAADCVSRAVRAEGTELRMAGDARREPWGWTVPIVLRRGTPAAVVGKLGELETTLDLPSGGLLAAPDRSRRARVVLRLAERDPFAGLLPAPAHLPASLSIRDAHVVGRRMDGTDLALCLLGVHGVVIGTPGAGKSMTLRTLADAVSACADAVVWDLDPSGNGLDVLGAAVGRREREPAEIEDALGDARALAEARPRMFTELDMGDAWQPSRERPAVVVVIDEYPRLSDRAKALAVDLIRVGRKARVTVLLAASEATSDTLGAAIADTAALKILMPCRHADVRLVLGPNMIAEGWRPDRLNPATGDSPEDAGCCYVYAASAREPVVSKIRTLDGNRAREQGAHRAAHGLPRIDSESWAAARARRQAEPGGRPADSVDAQGVIDVLTAFDGLDKLWTEDLLARLSTVDQRYAEWTAEDLAALLAPLGVGPTQIKINGRNRNGYHRRAITDAWNNYRHRS